MPRPVPLFCWYFIIASPLAFAQSIDLAAPIAPVSALESLRISAAGELGKQEDQCYETQSHNSPRASIRGGYFQGGKCRVRNDSCEQICEKGVAFLPLNSLVGRTPMRRFRSGCCARARLARDNLACSIEVACSHVSRTEASSFGTGPPFDPAGPRMVGWAEKASRE